MTLMKALILLWLFCSLITASSSEFPAGRPRVPSHSNGISTAVSSSPIRYQGSAYEGLDERVWRLGGATITVQVASDLTFQFPNTLLDGSNNERAREEYRVRQLLSVLGTPNSETSALAPLAEEELQTLTEQCIRPAVATSRTTITNGGKLVKIVLGPAPDCTMSSPVLIGVQLPLSFVKSYESDSFSESDLFGAPSFLMVPGERLQLANAAMELIAGRLTSVPLRLDRVVDIPTQLDQFRIIDGTSCKALHDARVRDLEWNPITGVLTFRPLLGGTLSICYEIYPKLEWTFMRVGGSLSVSGAEGVVTEPPTPHASEEFSGMIYGTNLTEDDELLITREVCAKAVPNEYNTYDLTLSSPSRAVFNANVPSQGLYNVCYRRRGSPQLVHVSTIRVDAGSQFIIDRNYKQLWIDQDSTLTQSASIDFLTLQAGYTLNLENHRLNVSHFVWESGTLTGYGPLNILGSNSKIAAFGETRVIDTVVHNYGSTTLELRELVFRDHGALYNYGDLTIIVNTTGPQDSGLIQSTGKSKVIVNGPTGKMTFQMLMPGGSLRINGAVENRGTMLIAPGSVVEIADFSTPQVSVTTVSSNSRLRLRHADLAGLMQLSSHSELEITGDASLRRCTFRGSGTVSLLAGALHIDHVVFGDSLWVDMDGQRPLASFTSKRDNTPEAASAPAAPTPLLQNSNKDRHLLIDLEGTVSFAERTHTTIRGVMFQAYDLCKLVFHGRVAIDISSAYFGSNIAVHSNLAAVMFGQGAVRRAQRSMASSATASPTLIGGPHEEDLDDEDDEDILLTAQSMPRNSSFVIPPNTTLVIMDVGNLTQTALMNLRTPPKLCSHYVVVPMHVEIAGRVLLWGCAMMPLGGAVSGIIYEADAKEIEATVQFAFCRRVLVDEKTCVNFFPNPSDERPTSGLLVSGSLTLSQTVATGSRTMSESVSLSHTTSRTFASASTLAVKLDSLELHRAWVTLADQLSLTLNRDIYVSPSSRLILTHGGLITAPSIRIDGLLQLEGGAPLVLVGMTDVGRTGAVSVALDTTMCNVPLQVEDRIRFHPQSQLQCVAALNRTSSSGSLITFHSADGRPVVNSDSCIDNRHEVTGALKTSDHQFGLTFSMRSSIPSVPTQIALAIVGLLLAAGLLYLAVIFFGLTLSAFAREVVEKSILTLHLSRPEFHCISRNSFILMGYVFEAVCLCATAFHSSVPLPSDMNRAVSASMWLMLPQRQGSTPVILGGLIALIVVWFLSWIPLFVHSISAVMERLASRDSKDYLTFLYFRFQMHMCFWSSILFVPILSYLLEGVACSTFLSDMSSCDRYSIGYTLPSLVASVLFLIMVPLSASYRAFPFAHPPFRDADLRSKRSFTVLQVLIQFMQVLSWKIFATNAVMLILSSLVLVGLHATLIHISQPCGYQNINRLRAALLLLPLWSLICSLIQLMRFGEGSQFLCDGGDAKFSILFFIGIAGALYAIYRSPQPSDTPVAIEDAAVQCYRSELLAASEDLEKCRDKLYAAPNRATRDHFAREMQEKRGNFYTRLNNYRMAKESYLIRYYIKAEQFGAQDVSEDGEVMVEIDGQSQGKVLDSSAGDSSASPRTPAMGPSTPMMDGGENILPQEEMERFHCGPLLGRGSYGSVHMGMLPSGKLVAVKVIQIIRKKKDQLTAVKKEVNMLRTLCHDNIIRYYGCIAQAGYMHVFMEFAVGGSLTSLVRKFERLSEPVMCFYTLQILKGLDFLHSRHVVHRDIKGENILIDGHGVAKLADFGCSKALADIANRSQAGCDTLVGSPYWMAPEVIKNEAYGTKADIWSVGCTVVEMLNGGDPPWHNRFDNVYSAMFFIAGTTEIPNNVPEEISDTCRDFLARCFERDVSKRATASELLKHPWLENVSSPQSDASPKAERQWSEMFDGEETGMESKAVTTSPEQSVASSRQELLSSHQEKRREEDPLDQRQYSEFV